MFTFISENIGSLLVILGILLIVTLIVLANVRKKRSGRPTCGCGCKSCPMASKCHQEKGEQS